MSGDYSSPFYCFYSSLAWNFFVVRTEAYQIIILHATKPGKKKFGLPWDYHAVIG